MIHFKQRLLPKCLPHDLEIVTVNGGKSISQYHTPLAVAKFTGKWKKIKSCYFIATSRICELVQNRIYFETEITKVVHTWSTRSPLLSC